MEIIDPKDYQDKEFDVDSIIGKETNPTAQIDLLQEAAIKIQEEINIRAKDLPYTFINRLYNYINLLNTNNYQQIYEFFLKSRQHEDIKKLTNNLYHSSYKVFKDGVEQKKFHKNYKNILLKINGPLEEIKKTLTAKNAVYNTTIQEIGTKNVKTKQETPQQKLLKQKIQKNDDILKLVEIIERYFDNCFTFCEENRKHNLEKKLGIIKEKIVDLQNGQKHEQAVLQPVAAQKQLVNQKTIKQTFVGIQEPDDKELDIELEKLDMETKEDELKNIMQNEETREGEPIKSDKDQQEEDEQVGKKQEKQKTVTDLKKLGIQPQTNLGDPQVIVEKPKAEAEAEKQSQLKILSTSKLPVNSKHEREVVADTKESQDTNGPKLEKIVEKPTTEIKSEEQTTETQPQSVEQTPQSVEDYCKLLKSSFKLSLLESNEEAKTSNTTVALEQSNVISDEQHDKAKEELEIRTQVAVKIIESIISKTEENIAKENTVKENTVKENTVKENTVEENIAKEKITEGTIQTVQTYLKEGKLPKIEKTKKKGEKITVDGEEVDKSSQQYTFAKAFIEKEVETLPEKVRMPDGSEDFTADFDTKLLDEGNKEITLSNVTGFDTNITFKFKLPSETSIQELLKTVRIEGFEKALSVLQNKSCGLITKATRIFLKNKKTTPTPCIEIIRDGTTVGEKESEHFRKLFYSESYEKSLAGQKQHTM